MVLSVVVTTTDTHRAIDAVWRIESARIIAGLTRIVRDVGLAEELAQDALVAALQQWPESGVPDNPGAWLMATAKHRAIDHFRRNALLERKHQEIVRELESKQEMAVADLHTAIDDEVGDDLLRLMFIACHPVLSTEARVALTLRLLGGLTTEEIARAFLASEPTIAQRIVRAKRTLADEHVPFEVPRGPELAARLSSVLEVIYLVFNEGYSATAGDDWMRPALCEEALRLGRILAELAPKEPEVHGLVALMEIQASRARARTGSVGRADPAARSKPRALGSTPDSSRFRGAQPCRKARRGAWRLCAPSGHRCLSRAGAFRRRRQTGRASSRSMKNSPSLQPSPIVELNRAVAVAMAYGPAAGLQIIDTLVSEPSLKAYHLLPSVRGDFLFKLGRFAEAQAEFERAVSLTRNAREREFLLDRARACAERQSNSAER